jgi:hypothetical protein
MKKSLSDWVDVAYGSLFVTTVFAVLVWGGATIYATCSSNDTCNSGNCVLSSGGCRNNYPGDGPKDTCQTQSKETQCNTCSCQSYNGNCTCLQNTN